MGVHHSHPFANLLLQGRKIFQYLTVLVAIKPHHPNQSALEKNDYRFDNKLNVQALLSL